MCSSNFLNLLLEMMKVKGNISQVGHAAGYYVGSICIKLVTPESRIQYDLAPCFF